MTEPLLITSEPLNLPLNFTLTDKARAKAGFTMLEQGEYKATELRTYAVLRRCHGCGTAEKAMKLVRVQELDSGEVYEIGLQCMSDLYGVDLQAVNDHTKTVSASRRRLKQALGLTGDLSTDAMLSVVREALLTYVPVPERYVQELDRLDAWSLEPADDERAQELYRLALYHRDWAEQPGDARRRWQALRTHPVFPASRRSEVQAQCQRALEAKNLLNEQDVRRLNRLLRDAARYKQNRVRLASPEDFPSQTAYEQALRDRLEERVQFGERVDRRLSGDGTSHAVSPLSVVGDAARSLYATVGVWEDEVERFKDRVHQTDGYWKTYRRPLIAVGPVDREQFPEREGRRINARTNEWEDYVIEPAWTFIFRRVAWTLVEPYTDTHHLWHTFGRDRLERYL